MFKNATAYRLLDTPTPTTDTFVRTSTAPRQRSIFAFITNNTHSTGPRPDNMKHHHKSGGRVLDGPPVATLSQLRTQRSAGRTERGRLFSNCRKWMQTLLCPIIWHRRVHSTATRTTIVFAAIKRATTVINGSEEGTINRKFSTVVNRS